jgi:hypothetical protein
MAKGALAKVSPENRTPAMMAVLGSGWTIRQLAAELSSRPFSWNEKAPVPISHNHLSRMLRGTATITDDVRRAVREVAKVKI